VEDGIRVRLRVQPKASRDRIDGLARGPDGAGILKLRVTAAPEDGKANSAVVKLLAKAWGLPKSSLGIIAGASDRNKAVLIQGDPTELMPRLRSWLSALGNP